MVINVNTRPMNSVNEIMKYNRSSTCNTEELVYGWYGRCSFQFLLILNIDFKHTVYMSMIYFSVSDLSYERDILASLFTEYSKLVTIHAVATQFILSN